MKLDPVSILESIVDADGDCDAFAGPAICKRCPLGNKRIESRRVNCMDFLKITDEMTLEQISEIYKKAAQEELFTLEFESLLSEK